MLITFISSYSYSFSFLRELKTIIGTVLGTSSHSPYACTTMQSDVGCMYQELTAQSDIFAQYQTLKDVDEAYQYLHNLLQAYSKKLELFIKEMSIWKLPPNSQECDETCVEVNVFGNKKVPISGYVFGKNSTMNRGQNFLFTLNAIPTGENVFLNIFKKAFNREKNLAGSSKIPIEQIFSDLFVQSFNTAQTQAGPNLQTPAPNPAAPNVSLQHVQTQPTPQSGQIQPTPQSGQIQPTPQPGQIQPTPQSGQIQPTPQPGQIQPTPQSGQIQPTPQSGQIQPTPQPGQTQATSQSDQIQPTPQPVHTLQPIGVQVQMQNPVSATDPTERSPISKLTKDVYPIIGVDSKQWGSICILMRLTSFGCFSAHPIHIHQSHNEIILQNTPNTAMYKCVPLDALNKMKLNDERSLSSRKQHPPMNKCTDLVQTNNMSTSDSDLCPCPPTSPNDTQYEEFKAEVNDNVLCVRMPKNGGIVRRVYDNNQSPKKINYSDNRENVYDDHIKSIPIIRGNRKYPAHYGEMSSFPSSCNKNSLVYEQGPKTKDFNLQCAENRILQDNISCPSDVQIIRKNNDPKRDVFVLNIGKDAGGQNGIQLEMKTPKNPFANTSAYKHTTSAQTYDDEFISQIKKGGKAKGKKGGKKK